MTTSNPIQILLNQKSDTKKLVDISIIKSPMKYEILNLLRHDEMSFEDIVANTSKSKASVSMHLKGLREAGIVEYKANPADNRKKIFFLKSEYLGSLTPQEDIKENRTEKLIEEFIEQGDVEYTLMLVHTFKSILSDYGIEIDEVLKSIGKHMGRYIYNNVKSDDLDEFMANVAGYWDENNLGYLTFNVDKNIKISCRECFESKNSPVSGKPVCFIESGMLESLFEQYFKIDLNIVEVKCYSMGDEECLFEIEP